MCLFLLNFAPHPHYLEASSVALCLLGIKLKKKKNIGVLDRYVAKKFRPRKSFSCLATDMAEKKYFWVVGSNMNFCFLKKNSCAPV